MKVRSVRVMMDCGFCEEASGTCVNCKGTGEVRYDMPLDDFASLFEAVSHKVERKLESGSIVCQTVLQLRPKEGE